MISKDTFQLLIKEMSDSDFHNFVLQLENKDFHPETHKINLTDEAKLLRGLNIEKLLVVVYADWCGACQSAKPEIEKAAKELYKSHILVTSIPVHGADQDKALSERLEKIFPGWKGGIPFIAVIDLKTQKVAPYCGARKSEAIVHFAKSVGM